MYKPLALPKEGKIGNFATDILDFVYLRFAFQNVHKNHLGRDLTAASRMAEQFGEVGGDAPEYFSLV